MIPRRISLQNRITTLITISSIFSISIFTFIQLNIQMDNINRYNTDRSSLSVEIVKNNLENIILKAEESGTELPKHFQATLMKLKGIEVFKSALVFDNEGKIVAATENSRIGDSVTYKELDRIGDLRFIAKEKKWYIPEIDKGRQLLNIYMALHNSPEEPISYVAKISFSLGNIQEAFLLVFKPVILTAVIMIILNILFGYLLSENVVGPVKILNKVTKFIAAGNLSVRTEIRTKDELQELGDTFNYMTEELLKMKERAENANPLTKLPGNIVIREEIEKKIIGDKKFTLIYCDLDNFKAFNDNYGIAKGDDAIKMVADIAKEAVKNAGNPEDFIGHEGGDDFMLLTSPDKAQDVADYILKAFPLRVRALYDKETLKLGYIVANARDGSVAQYPIMTISLAGVTNNHRTISSYVEVTNIAAEVKRKAKSICDNTFIIDKRKT